MKDKSLLFILLLVGITTLILGCTNADNKAASNQAEGPITHSVLICGRLTAIVDEENKIAWQAPIGHARDGYVLENGNILLTFKRQVIEYTRENKEVFKYIIDKANGEISTSQRLANGNTMVIELGSKPQLIEVTPKGDIAVRITLQPKDLKGVHHQTRMGRKLANGNYLVPHLSDCRIREYNSKGEIVKTFDTAVKGMGPREGKGRPMPFTSIRLKNGNTFVNCTQSNKAIIMDPAGKIIWKLTNDDLPGNPLADPCGGQVLPNGNVVITSYGNKKGHIFEVTRDKKIVWELKRHAHGLQILTTNGKKIKNPLK